MNITVGEFIRVWGQGGWRPRQEAVLGVIVYYCSIHVIRIYDHSLLFYMLSMGLFQATASVLRQELLSFLQYNLRKP